MEWSCKLHYIDGLIIFVVLLSSLELDFAHEEPRGDVLSDVINDVPQVDTEKGMLTDIYSFFKLVWYVK